MGSYKWKTCQKSLFTTTKQAKFTLHLNHYHSHQFFPGMNEFKDDILLSRFGKSLLVCDFDLLCFKMKDNKFNLMNTKLTQEGIKLPFQADWLDNRVASQIQLATALDHQNSR